MWGRLAQKRGACSFWFTRWGRGNLILLFCKTDIMHVKPMKSGQRTLWNAFHFILISAFEQISLNPWNGYFLNINKQVKKLLKPQWAFEMSRQLNDFSVSTSSVFTSDGRAGFEGKREMSQVLYTHMELQDVSTTTLASSHFLHTNDVDGGCTSSVTSRHVSVWKYKMSPSIS